MSSGEGGSPLRLAAAVAAGLVLLVAVVVGAAAGAVGDAAGVLGGPRPASSATSRVAKGWPWGQCTWYVALRRVEMGEPVTWGGDAWQWLANAAAQGKPETSIPAPGEIVVYLRGGSYDSRYGHVALVVAAWPAGYVVAEANYDRLGVIDTRSISWPDPQVAGFIR
jgi:surface antigen